jgi:competence protein ComEA
MAIVCRSSGAIGAFAALLATSVALSSQDRFPDGPGKADVMKVCSGCHDAEIILANLKTPGEWNETLQNMATQGAEATPEQWKVIEQYIDVHFAMVMVNKAPADEIQLALDVPADVAAALVKYRQEKGPFKSIDDVKKVPGIDAAKVDAATSRLVF